MCIRRGVIYFMLHQVLPDRLRLRPQLIEGVSRMALRRIFYCGERLDIEYNDTVATVTQAGAPGGGEVASGAGAAKSRLTLPPAFSTVS